LTNLIPVIHINAQRNGQDVSLNGHRDPSGVIHVLEVPAKSRTAAYPDLEQNVFELVHRIEPNGNYTVTTLNHELGNKRGSARPGNEGDLVLVEPIRDQIKLRS
jgi:hypothetical protein